MPGYTDIDLVPLGLPGALAALERNMIVDVRALVVRPPMAQRRRHPAQYLTTILSRSIHHEPGDSAHGRCTQARGQERRWKPTGSEK